MLLVRNQLQFEAGYQLRYLKAKEESKLSNDLGGALPINVLEEGHPETSDAREAQGHEAHEGRGGLKVVPK